MATVNARLKIGNVCLGSQDNMCRRETTKCAFQVTAAYRKYRGSEADAKFAEPNLSVVDLVAQKEVVNIHIMDRRPGPPCTIPDSLLKPSLSPYLRRCSDSSHQL